MKFTSIHESLLAGSLIIALPALWFLTLRSPFRGLLGLIISVPLAGIVALWCGPAVWPKVLKGICFLIPLYAAALARQLRRRELLPDIPRPLIMILTVLSLLVILQMLNPHVTNSKVAWIGAGVWLSHLPLVLVGFMFVNSTAQIKRLLAIFVGFSAIPVTIAFIQWLGCQTVGYRETMTAFLGTSAEAATQRFALFQLGGGTIVRIPSTFTFPSQYVNYILCAITATLLYIRIQTMKNRRILLCVWLGCLVLAGYVSGSRASFVFIPLLVVGGFTAQRRYRTAAIWAVVCLLLLVVYLKLPWLTGRAYKKILALRNPVAAPLMQLPINAPAGPSALAGRPSRQTAARAAHHSAPVVSVLEAPPEVQGAMSMGSWWDMMLGLFKTYPKYFFYSGFAQSFSEAPFGLGTGMNTGAARFAFEDQGSFVAFESYYVKAARELGIIGLLTVFALFGWIFYAALSWWKEIDDPLFRQWTGIYVAFVAVVFIYNFKGWALDLDPLNLLFWLFLGVYIRAAHLFGEGAQAGADLRRAV